MFISYIIPPFQSEEYLVRCLESLYGQTSDNFEVIVAEYQFGSCDDYIKHALETKPNFKIIDECTDEEKFRAAVKLVSESAEYVQLIEATTVAVPHAVETLQKAANDAELLLPATIVRIADRFVKRFCHGWEKISVTEGFTAFDYCFKKSLFDRCIESIADDFNRAETLLDVLLGSGTSMTYVESVCYYIAPVEIHAPTIASEQYEMLTRISDSVCKDELGSIKVKMYTKYVRRLMMVIDSEDSDYDDQQRAYETLKKFGKDASESYILSKIFSINTGVPVTDMDHVDLGGYKTLRNEIFRLTDTTTSVSAIQEIFREQELKRMDDAMRLEKWIKAYNAERAANQEAGKKLHDDIQAVSANLHCLMQRIEEGGIGQKGGVSTFTNPVTEVPYLFATGRLGFKTIFKCINGWFRYKFSGKK